MADKMKELQIVSVSGKDVIGYVDVENVAIVDSLDLASTSQGVAGWVRANELNELVTLKLSPNSEYTVRDLNDSEKALMAVAVESMALAKGSAVQQIICDRFDKLMRR